MPIILLAEDSESDVLLLERAFHQMGVQVLLHSVHDGGEAISYLEGQGKYAHRDEFRIETSEMYRQVMAIRSADATSDSLPWLLVLVLRRRLRSQLCPSQVRPGAIDDRGPGSRIVLE